jgi:hypothetical protein
MITNRFTKLQKDYIKLLKTPDIQDYEIEVGEVTEDRSYKWGLGRYNIAELFSVFENVLNSRQCDKKHTIRYLNKNKKWSFRKIGAFIERYPHLFFANFANKKKGK